MRFKIWIEGQDLVGKDSKMAEIWNMAFDALGIGGMDKLDAEHMSLSKIQYGRGPTAGSEKKLESGKRAVSKRLQPVFQRLKELGDPELAKNVEMVQKDLDSTEADRPGDKEGPFVAHNASTTVGEMLKKLFGDKNYNVFSGQSPAQPDQAKAQVQPQPPKQNPTPNTSMDQNTPQPNPGGPPMGGGQGTQPQAPGNMQPPAPTNPMQPPPPAGAFMGLW